MTTEERQALWRSLRVQVAAAHMSPEKRERAIELSTYRCIDIQRFTDTLESVVYKDPPTLRELAEADPHVHEWERITDPDDPWLCHVEACECGAARQVFDA